ncbi:MAG: hypothetical protein ACRC28_18815 [Clostridium sp.]|uniref:hypothetical protein n=1 Tax=Clostridium sp. TaxID=1506 RepID=UPI003F34741A
MKEVEKANHLKEIEILKLVLTVNNKKIKELKDENDTVIDCITKINELIGNKEPMWFEGSYKLMRNSCNKCCVDCDRELSCNFNCGCQGISCGKCKY